VGGGRGGGVGGWVGGGGGGGGVGGGGVGGPSPPTPKPPFYCSGVSVSVRAAAGRLPHMSVPVPGRSRPLAPTQSRMREHTVDCCAATV